ncbi:hypothetical protein ACO0SA_000456 [Hanseniaspora valbyensis]
MAFLDSVKRNFLYRENLLLRRKASLSVLLIYFFIGLPVWYHLTKVDQYELDPLMDSEKLKTPYLFKENNPNEESDFLKEINLKLPVNLNLTNTFYKFPDLLNSTQKELDAMLGRYKDEYGFNSLNLSIELKDVGNTPAEWFYENNEYLVQLQHDSYMGNYIYLYEKLEVVVQYDDRSVYENVLPTLVANSILNHFFFEKIDVANEFDRRLNLEKNIVDLKYTPKIKLVLNLIINDNLLADWDLKDFDQSKVMQEVLLPFMEMFEGVYKFEIESNILYNEDLNLKDWAGAADEIDDLQSQLDISRLSDRAFVDNIEDRVLNFVVVFPENENLEGKNDNNSTEETTEDVIISNKNNNKFLSYNLPEWGSIFIYKGLLTNLEKEQEGKDLDSVYLKDSILEPLFITFLKEVFPILTSSKKEEGGEQVVFSITKFIKKAILSNIYRTNKNIKAVYDMIYKLPVVTDESLNGLIPEEYQPYLQEFMNKFFPSLSIPQKIHSQLVEVISQREILLEKLNTTGNTNDKFKQYLKESFSFYKLSEETFFDHEMVMGNYKSLKHVIAVYLPLLGPVCSITIGGVIQLLKKTKKDPLIEKKEEKIKKEQ